MADKRTRGEKNNNPGNLRRTGDKWQGLSQDQSQDKEFCVFDHPKWGIRALARVLIAYQDKLNINTVAGIINKWAPPSENNTKSYIKSVAQVLNVEPNDPINVHEYKTLYALTYAIIRHENGRVIFDKETIDAGLKLAGVEPELKPMAESNIVKGSTVAGVAGAATVVASAAPTTLATLAPYSDTIVQALPVVQTLASSAPWVLGLVVVIAAAFVIYHRYQQRKAGIA